MALSDPVDCESAPDSESESQEPAGWHAPALIYKPSANAIFHRGTDTLPAPRERFAGGSPTTILRGRRESTASSRSRRPSPWSASSSLSDVGVGRWSPDCLRARSQPTVAQGTPSSVDRDGCECPTDRSPDIGWSCMYPRMAVETGLSPACAVRGPYCGASSGRRRVQRRREHDLSPVDQQTVPASRTGAISQGAARSRAASLTARAPSRTCPPAAVLRSRSRIRRCNPVRSPASTAARTARSTQQRTAAKQPSRARDLARQRPMGRPRRPVHSRPLIPRRRGGRQRTRCSATAAARSTELYPWPAPGADAHRVCATFRAHRRYARRQRVPANTNAAPGHEPGGRPAPGQKHVRRERASRRRGRECECERSDRRPPDRIRPRRGARRPSPLGTFPIVHSRQSGHALSNWQRQCGRVRAHSASVAAPCLPDRRERARVASYLSDGRRQRRAAREIASANDEVFIDDKCHAVVGGKSAAPLVRGHQAPQAREGRAGVGVRPRAIARVERPAAGSANRFPLQHSTATNATAERARRRPARLMSVERATAPGQLVAAAASRATMARTLSAPPQTAACVSSSLRS